MSNKVQFGIGGVYFLSINQVTGELDKYIPTIATASSNAYNPLTRTLTTSATYWGEVAPYKAFVAGDKVVIVKLNTNSFAFGTAVTNTTILIDDESDDSWLADGIDIRISKGIGAGLFKNVSVVSTSTPVEFKGTNKFTREVAYTDGDVKVTVEEFILNTSALEYLNGINGVDYAGGKSFVVMDNQFGNTVTPVDVMVLITKLKTGETAKYEEIQLPRIKSSSLALPFNRNNFVTTNYEFDAQTKNAGDSTLLRFVTEV